jgi:hypothetical protein
MPIAKTAGKTEPEFKTPDEASVDTPTDDNPPDVKNTPETVSDYVYVTYPDGSLHAVHRADVEASNARTELPAAPKKAVKEQEWYAHLASGDVVRLKTSELPATAGAQNFHGFYISDGYAHTVIGVYPVETPHIDSDTE